MQGLLDVHPYACNWTIEIKQTGPLITGVKWDLNLHSDDVIHVQHAIVLLIYGFIQFWLIGSGHSLLVIWYAQFIGITESASNTSSYTADFILTKSTQGIQSFNRSLFMCRASSNFSFYEALGNFDCSSTPGMHLYCIQSIVFIIKIFILFIATVLCSPAFGALLTCRVLLTVLNWWCTTIISFLCSLGKSLVYLLNSHPSFGTPLVQVELSRPDAATK